MEDGGPAYPIPEQQFTDGVTLVSSPGHPGMSLRDRMAIGCMDIARADYFSNVRKAYGDDSKEPILPYATKGAGTMEQIIARHAYAYADAMLAARGSPHG